MGINVTRRSSIRFAYLAELVNWLTRKELLAKQEETLLLDKLNKIYAGSCVYKSR